jgi:ankyrin repeat protein
MLESLIQYYHANIQATDKNGRTALMLASGCHLDTLTCEADECSTKKDDECSTKKDDDDLTVFCPRGHLGAVKYLIKHGCDIHAADKNGNTALRHAQLAGRENVIQYLTK